MPYSPVVLDKAELPSSLRSLPQPLNTGPIRSLTQNNRLFGRWRALLSDSSRLAVESDFTREGPAKSWNGPLLVDKLEHRGDLALWSCLLDYQTRTNGDLGALKIWRALWGRKSLHDIESPLAPVFWQTILEAATRSDNHKFLQDVFVYSEWMYETYQVKWPHLYFTIIAHFLRTLQHRQALRWHLRLMPTFYPGPDKFVDILQEFAGERELYLSSTLQSLYILNPDRQLYDKLVPYLYARGKSALAIAWRDILIRHDDVPLLPVPVRPFLRYLQGYFPKRPLHPREETVMSPGTSWTEDEEPPNVSREFVNRVHGGTFGISVKNYNDGLGAKWFASSWISLETAMSTVAALGVARIGPLSLQSIALREETSEGVLKRMAQLQSHGITVADSNYLRIVLHFVKIHDDELLFDLLQSDFHPDVFDNLQLLSQLLESTVASDDWRTYRLLLVARIIIMQKTTREAANAVLQACFIRRDEQGVFRALDDIESMKIGIDYDQVNLFFQSLLADVRVHRFGSDSFKIAAFYLSLCLRLVSMEVPVPVACWRQLVTSIGRQERLDDLERLCIRLVSLFTSSGSSRPGFIPVHLNDIPKPMKQPLLEVENLLGVYVPEDLPNSVPLHPLRQIFDVKMVNALVRWTFRATLGRQQQAERARPAAMAPADPSRRRRGDFHCARGVRLVRALRDRGLFVRRQEVARGVVVRLVDLYGTDLHTKRELRRAKANNILSLAEMKALLDEAWGSGGGGGSGLLPPLAELRAEVDRLGRAKTQKNLEYLARCARTPPRLPPASSVSYPGYG